MELTGLEIIMGGAILSGVVGLGTWGDLATYAGSFWPDTTLDKLMLGYNNPYPMWFNKIAVWNKQVDDAAILEALN